MALAENLKRVLFGNPISNKLAAHEKLIIPVGLAVFASDALSSVAYASDEIMLVLAGAGPMALRDVFPISIALVLLMVLVVFSYRQTIWAYPEGGGTYIVSSQNLGRFAGLTAGASLMTDYILTVAVSVSSGVAALVSMIPSLQGYTVYLAMGFVAFLGLVNLRGVKESGIAFAIPTYFFVGMVLVLIGAALFRGLGQPTVPIHPQGPVHFGSGGLTFFLMLRAFAAACTAMTGTEAIADGVQAFRAPAARNASRTLMLMAGLLVAMFLGISWSAAHYGIVPMRIEEPGYRTVLAQIGETLFGRGMFFYTLQLATALILLLAANTAFADFPRLSSFLARDRFLPRQLLSLGDRLVYQNGIALLAVASAILVAVFQADTHLLVPLYAVGVFISFTLSQAGMAVRFLRRGATRRVAPGVISVVGSVATGIVAVVLLVTKFHEGAWMIGVTIVALILLFLFIRSHYDSIDAALKAKRPLAARHHQHKALLVVPRMHTGAQQALEYAQLLNVDARALHVVLDEEGAKRLKEDWNKYDSEIPLILLDSPYRSLIDPIVEYIDQLRADDPDMLLTVILPEAVPTSFWARFLHGSAAGRLKARIGQRRGVIVTNVRYFLDAPATG